MKTNEARAVVKELVASDDVETAVADFIRYGEAAHRDDVGDSGVLSVLKVAEYALLVGPVSDGLRAVNEKWDATFPSSLRLYSIEQICEMAGDYTFLEVFSCLEDRMEAIDKIAQRRSLILNASSGVRDSYGRMVCPFDLNLRAASKNAASSAGLSVVSCALALERSTECKDMTKTDKLEVVKGSPQLFLAQPMVHLRDLPMVSSILSSDNQTVFDGYFGSDFSRLVKFNPVSGKVEMVDGIRNWSREWNQVKVGDRGSEKVDVRLGCPFTFAPKASRLQYYRNIAQLIYDTGYWPYPLVRSS